MSEFEYHPQELANLKYLRDMSWDEVKQSWKDDEDSHSFKREYTEHGHDTWESWRAVIFDTLHLTDLTWSQYEISEPENTVPQFHGGPFTPWKKLYYGDKQMPTFKEIVEIENSDVSTRDKFSSIISSTTPIQLIGLQKDDEIYIIEGMHRSTSIALAASRGQKLHTKVSILLAKTNLHEFEMID